MQSLIWSLASLFILTPIVYLLPMGVTNRGKFLLVLSAYVLALTVLLARTFYQPMQLTMMVAALLFFTSFFIHKRFQKFVFVSLPTGSDEKVLDAVIGKEESVSYDHSTFSDILPDFKIQSILEEQAELNPLSFIEESEENETVSKSDEMQQIPPDIIPSSNHEILLEDNSGSEMKVEHTLDFLEEDLKKAEENILNNSLTYSSEIENWSDDSASNPIHENMSDEQDETLNTNRWETDRNWLDHLDELDELSFNKS